LVQKEKTKGSDEKGRTTVDDFLKSSSVKAGQGAQKLWREAHLQGALQE